jgi:pimeloyl-CoA synthetase
MYLSGNPAASNLGYYRLYRFKQNTLDPGSRAYREDDKDKNGYLNSDSLTTV